MNDVFDSQELANAIAITGLACRFPDANSPEEFWRNLRSGRDSTKILSDDELRAAGMDPAVRTLPNFVDRGVVLENIDLFDADFFGLNPRETEILDPQQRIFLECSWQALEDAGCAATREDLLVGVFAGADLSSYLFNIMSNPEIIAAVGEFAVALANDKDNLTTRTAYALNLKGPAITVQTNCSTSLVAVCMAAQSLLHYQCDIALAGGSSVSVPQGRGYQWIDGGIKSPDGRCRAFDAEARGTSTGSGAGVVVLKRYEDALHDGDNIYAVIRGFGLNNDGSGKNGYTAPSVEGQAAAIRSALAMAGVEPETIDYVEAHGTGTLLGDPIEVAALTEVFRRRGKSSPHCGLGSVKTNFGHLGCAAGVAGLMKAVLSLRNQQLPPSLNYLRPNPHIDFSKSSFFVVDSLQAWKNGSHPRRAGVSSFGIGGTNAHVVLEEAAQTPNADRGREWQVLPVSAKTPSALERACENITAFLKENPDANLADVAFTLQTGRRSFPYRRAMIAGDPAVISGTSAGSPAVVFLFPGQGTQYPGMGHELYEKEPVFRRVVDDCCAQLRDVMQMDLRDTLLGANGADQLRQTQSAQPALFVIEYALTQLWKKWGVTPAALAGHSLGEYVAACVAGVFSLSDALRLVAVRGELMQSMPPGAMLAVFSSLDDIADITGGPLSLAAVNAPNVSIIAGPISEIERAHQELVTRGVKCKPLSTSHAFHSSMMAPIVDTFVEAVRTVKLNPPSIPCMSNLTGTWLTDAEATTPEYWGEHLRRTVRFADNLQVLREMPGSVLLEIGPRTFGNLSCLPAAEDAASSLKSLARAVGMLWTRGVAVDWDAIHEGENRRRVSLPTYPFQRQRYWIDLRQSASAAASVMRREGSSREQTPAPSTAPHSSVEERLLVLWTELLGTGPIGINDSFLECGGHSLLAVQMISRLREITDIDVSLADFLEAPTIAALIERLRHSTPARTRLCPMPRPERIPLSWAQQRLWFIERLEGGSTEYNLPDALRLRGDINLEALERALNTIIERHESLRTHFVEVDGEPMQVISPAFKISLVVEDLSAAPDALDQILANEWKEPFDLVHGPVIRVRLLRLGARDHVLLRTLHHIVSDAWSSGVFTDELGRLYEAYCTGRESTLSPLPVQYADYTQWQRQWLDSTAFQAGIDYWKKQLAGLPAVLDLPLDHPRPPRRTYRGAYCAVTLAPDALSALKCVGRSSDSTLFMTLLAALSVVFARDSGQDDFAIGAPIANRPELQLEQMIGFFVNTLVLRIKTDARQTFSELLRAVRETVIEAYRHQEIPFERLVEELAPVRDLRHSPFFQVMLALQNAPRGRQQLEGLEIDLVPFSEPRSRFDLEIHATERSGGLDFVWIYNPDLFNVERVEGLARSFLSVLERIGEQPEAPVRLLSALSSVERLTLLHRFETAALPAATLPDLFEAQAARTPDAAAIVCNDCSVTYGELNARANRLAHDLSRRGIGEESLVGIHMAQSVDMVVAVLGILKAGAAYLPLDLAYPQDRIDRMISMARPTMVLRDLASGEHGQASNPRRTGMHQDRAAYVIYTSGSTGVPKGVAVRHRELVQYLDWARRFYNVEQGIGAPVNTPLAFDATVTSLWLPLLAGKCVFLLPETRQLEALAELLISGIDLTLVKLTPAHLEALRDLLADRIERVRPCAFVVGGDALRGSIAHYWKSRVPGLRLFNEYGPTEAVVGCAVYEVPDAKSSGDVPIGVATPNTRLYVLDGALDLAPVGAAGELYIGGRQVASGYWNRAGLSAERFVADPYAAEPGARMYRTGDRARWTSHGTLEFLGRTDEQVKIRGFRVEPGEIESVLFAQPAVARAAVIASDDQVGNKQLVAYVSASVGFSIDEANLRRVLEEKLPSYMVPAEFVTLDALPMTTNGKLDRHALPALARSATRRRSYSRPRTQDEELLCAIFAEVLSLDYVGVDDDFFSLGGHSLLATRLVSRIRTIFRIEIALRALFEAPTVAKLAPQMRAAAPARTSIAVLPRPERLPLSYAQQRLWFLHRLEGISATYNIPHALRFTGEFDPVSFEAALASVVERHEVLRTVFPEVNGHPWQQVRPLEDVLPLLSIEDVAASDLSDRLNKAASTGFDLTREIPMRARIFRVSPSNHVVFLLFHHIASDASSAEIVSRDIECAYKANVEGVMPRYQPMPLQYADYAVWQRQTLSVEDEQHGMTKQLAFWRTALEFVPDKIALPTTHARPPVPSYRGSAEPLHIDRTLHQRLREFARSHGASLFMVIQAAFAALLSKIGAGEDIPIGTVIDGRSEQMLENVAGCFLNTLVLRCDLSGRPSFGELIRRVRAFDLDAFANQDVPFERVVEELRPERSMAHHPLFQVALTMQNFTVDLATHDRGPAVQIEPVVMQVAKFDLLLGLAESLSKDGEPLGVHGGLEYNLDLFDHRTAEWMAEKLVQLLEATLVAPDVPLHQISILTDAEREELFLIGDSAPADSSTSFVDMFESRVARDPIAVALIAGAEVLSYGELNARSNQLANFLVSEGVGGERIVGLYLTRSMEVIVAILAVMKAGAAYLPLDPKYPASRIASMIADSGLEVILTTRELARDLLDVSPRLIVLDSVKLETPCTNPCVAVLPGQLAYVIYTSGSTGVPKGVAVSHAGIVSLAKAQAKRMGIGAESRVIQLASLNFDASLSEIAMALGTGAALVVADDDARSGALLQDTLLSLRITHATFTPSVLATLDPTANFVLESVIVAGDVVTAGLANAWSKWRLLNAYGPTETTVCATMTKPLSPCDEAREPSIGSAIEGTRVYVLDHNLELAPIGVCGEIYIAGVGLARGYLGRAAGTAERFVASPYGDHAGRMYRTGDLGRWRADGTLEIIGRADRQLKIRGFRLEPGEIESAIRQCDGVRDAIVVPHQRPGMPLALAGYYVPERRLELWPSIAEFYVYDDIVYSSMERDEARNDRYRAAFAHHLKDQVAVDIGAGPYAILARLAIEAGAKHVYAIELLEETARAAHRFVASQGLSSRITVIQGDARHVELPEKADWCISEIVGAIGGSEGAAVIIDSARRLLKDGRNMLPRRSITKIAACSFPEGSFYWGFTPTAARYVERIWSEQGRSFDLRVCVKGARRSNLLSEEGVFEDLDFTQPSMSTAIVNQELEIVRPGVVTGFLVWLNLEVDEEASIDILSNQGSWVPVYLPLPEGIPTERGDRVEMRVKRDLGANGLNPDFRVEGMIRRNHAPEAPFEIAAPHAAEAFRASPFYSRLFAQDCVPVQKLPTPARIREQLMVKLPSHALPAWLVELEAMPLNVSGKIDRNALPAPDRRPESYEPPQTPQERLLCDLFSEVLKLERVGRHEGFFALGGDSILSILLVSRARRGGLVLSPRDVFEHQTVAQLAPVAVPVEGHGQSDRNEPGFGDVIATPVIQWWMTRGGAWRHFYQSMAIDVPAELSRDAMLSGLQAVLDAHHALRMRVERTEHGEWKLHIPPPGDLNAADCLVSGATPAAHLDPEAGRLVAASWDEQSKQLLLAIHHLAVDGVSWLILKTDLAAAWDAARQGKPVNTCKEGTTFRAWAQYLTDRATSAKIKTELPHWKSIVEGGGPLLAGRDFALGVTSEDTFATVRHLQVELDIETTRTLLTLAPQAFHTGVNTVLLTALAMAVKGKPLLVDMESHGRTPLDGELKIDLSRTVGWFTSVYPVSMDLSGINIDNAFAGGSATGTALKRVKEQLHSVPLDGLGYGMLRYMSSDSPVELLHRQAQVGFNYLGRWAQSQEAGTGGNLGGGMDAETKAFHILDINAQALDSAAGPRLVTQWNWASRLIDEAEVRELAAAWARAAAAIALHAGQPETGGHTTSDFPLVALTQEQVEALEAWRHPVRLKDVLPLSPLQEGLLFQSLYDDGATDLYTVQVVLQFAGKIDSARMCAAVTALLARHDNLGGQLRWEGLARPVQVIDASANLPWNEEDLSGFDEGECELRRAELHQRERRRFDLAGEPLVRFCLLKLTQDRHELIVCNHHLLLDGWSLPVVLGDLLALYRTGGTAATLPHVYPYKNYLRWLSAQDTEAALSAWRSYLADLEEGLLLAKGRTHAQAEPKSWRKELSADATARLQNMARERGLTLNTVVQGLWAILLSRITGRDDVVFGVTVAGRPAELTGVERMVGLFINTLPLRVRLRRSDSLSAMLAGLQDSQVRLMSFQHVGLPDIQKAAGLTDLFDTIVGFENYPVERGDFADPFPDLRLTGVLAHDSTHYPLTLIVAPGTSLYLRLDYDAYLFSAAVAEGIGNQFVRLLEQAAIAPDASIGSLDILTGEEMQSQREFNETTRSVDSRSLVVRVEALAAECPDAIALIAGDEIVSYAELNRRANRLAHGLIASGVGRESIVAICLNRSVKMAIAVLGIWKAGGAYLPLDPEYPQARLRHMLDDARPRWVLSEKGPRDRLPGNAAVLEEIEVDNEENPAIDVLPQQAAYLLYTSGSTGRPKGVIVSHGGLPSLIETHIERLDLDAKSRVLQFASLNFDASLWEISMAWGIGAALVILKEEERMGAALCAAITRTGATHSLLPPALLAGLGDDEVPTLKTLIVGGEACSGAVVERFSRGRRMVNAYGPTEVTVCATISAPLEGGGTPPLGRPVWNTRVYVLDRDLQPVPTGVLGEIYVSGAALARGYLNLSSQTSERFVADPYGTPGTRMYRTGDLARWRPDGNLDYAGRADDQVKLRGHRIELGEIESTLRAHPRVSDALVRVHGEGEAKQLLGYIVSRLDEPDAIEAGETHIDQWRQLYDSTYTQTAPLDTDFNISGWNSSYTGEPIEPAEMRIWVNETVARIRSLKPTRVLEIGCGTGLLLTRVAPDCERYTGLDFSEDVVGQLARYTAGRADLKHVEMRRGLADELAFADDDSVDLVVLNSVIQYFPSMGYLMNVLEQALRVTRPGGHIFVGDVRSLALLEAYHTSVQLYKTSGATSAGELGRRIAQAIRNEKELTIDPEFFVELARKHKKLARAERLLKAGDYDNELSRFRYDVVLRVADDNGPECIAEPDLWVTWDIAGKWRETVEVALQNKPAVAVGVSGIPDRRSAPATAAVRLLRRESLADVAAIEDVCSNATGENPDQVIKLADRLGVRIVWDGFDSKAQYTAILSPRWMSAPSPSEPAKGWWMRYGNMPSRVLSDEKLSHVLQEYAREVLPGYMIPSSIVVLQSWPLTPNGKLDYKALPAVDAHSQGYRAPRTPEEHVLCTLFADVLAASHVGLDDNFFAAGGHSLLAMRLVTRIRSVLGVELPVRALFECPTPDTLARRLNLQSSPDSAFARLLPLRPRGTQPPLFCIHPAGGLSWCYAGLLREIDPERPIYGLQSSIMLEEEHLPISVEQIVADYLVSIRDVQPTGPYYLLGWSFGGLVAHGIACQLQEAGENVQLLALLDTYPVENKAEKHKPTGEEILTAIAGNLGLDPGEFKGAALSIATIVDAARRIGHFVGNLEAHHSVQQARTLQHNAALTLEYDLGRFDGDALLFAAVGSAGEVPARPEEWAFHITGRIDVETIRCQHPEMARPLNLRTIGRRLDQYLRRTSQRARV